VVSAHLHRNGPLALAKLEMARFGEVVLCDELQIKLRVPRGRVAEAAAALLRQYDVADITIEEPEIGEIIERIMTARGGTEARSRP
jgi:ABC-type uncharacterized transport system ATPase subunit